MQDFEKLGVFYLGREYDPETLKPTDDLLLYDSKDLVTHAVCVGMTGSGKTGLCIDLLEEAAIDGVPALVIDPKGDLSNLLLQFPSLSSAEFEQWVNEEDATRQGITVQALAEQQATLWRDGLAKWGQDGARIQRLKDAADIAVYTPGSSAGIALSILKSFAAPPPEIVDDREVMRERVSVTATALLSLLGVDAEPMKSREHILVSTILDTAWRQGQSLDLAEVIHQIQKPPVTRVGVLDLESFYPSKDRFDLAMSLNNLLASPGFESWMEGEPLDVERLLRTSQGKPRISIVSISHLGDTERMFFVSLLLNEMLSWTRMQTGTTSLRAILYMDEIFGYFPPTANPPSKRPLLTLLKQARAFGVGIVLATQNPVDLDYKGLANCGTWFIGRLQTERDKARLMDGLQSASNEGGAHFDSAQMERLLASLGKRVFLMNNVHEDAPVLFESRWALSYLRGPLNKQQIRTLMQDRAKPAPAPSAAKPKTSVAAASAEGARVMLPPEIPQAYVPIRGSHEQIVYRPMLLSAAQIRFIDKGANVDFLRESVFATEIKDDSLPVQWEECEEIDVDPSDLDSEHEENAAFSKLPPAAGVVKNYVKWSKELVAWIYGHQVLEVFESPSAGLTSTPGEKEADFRVRLQQAAREQRDAALAKIRQKYASKVTVLQDRLRRAQQAVAREQEQKQQQTMSSMLSIGTSVVGALFGRKLLSKTNVASAASAARNMGRIGKESGDVARAQETVEAVTQQLADLEAQIKAETDAIAAKSDPMTENLGVCAIKPKKTNINVRLFTLAWVPYTSDGQPAWQ